MAEQERFGAKEVRDLLLPENGQDYQNWLRRSAAEGRSNETEVPCHSCPGPFVRCG